MYISLNFINFFRQNDGILLTIFFDKNSVKLKVRICIDFYHNLAISRNILPEVCAKVCKNFREINFMLNKESYRTLFWQKFRESNVLTNEITK